MSKEKLIDWIYNLPLQTLTDELKDDIVEKIEELNQNKTKMSEDKEYTLSDIAELLMQSESLPASVLILEELLKDYHRQLLNQNKDDE